MSTKHSHETVAQIERRKERIARRERKDKIWNIILLVIAAAFILTFIAIQISHHI